MTDEVNSDTETELDENDILNVIMLGRIYDMLVVIAQKTNPEDTEQMLRLHADGKLFGPPPLWNMGPDSE